MLTTTYFTVILLCLVFFIVGLIISHLLFGRKKEDYKSKFDEAEKTLAATIKKNKKLDKTLSSATSEKDTWKNKYVNLESESKLGKERYHSELVAKDKANSNIQMVLDKANNDNERILKDQEIISERYKKFKAKYDLIAGDQKRINKENSQFSHDNQQLGTSVKKLKEQVAQLKKEIQEQEETVASAKEIQKELRLLRVKNKKLTDDCAYWEKKHYDTHHELAQIKEQYTQTDSKYSELQAFRNGDQIIMDNLKKQIEQYKSKYIDVNHKYRELLSSN